MLAKTGKMHQKDDLQGGEDATRKSENLLSMQCFPRVEDFDIQHWPARRFGYEGCSLNLEHLRLASTYSVSEAEESCHLEHSPQGSSEATNAGRVCPPNDSLRL